MSDEKYPCPCGEGHYTYSHYYDDKDQLISNYTMLCPKCRELYVFSSAPVITKPWRGHERGWVLKSVLDKESNYRDECDQIVERAKELYSKEWTESIEKLVNLKTKKAMYDLFPCNGCGYENFCRHTRGRTKQRLIYYFNMQFTYNNLGRILKLCEIDTPDWGYMGVNAERIKELGY